jgi:hypothetical protein
MYLKKSPFSVDCSVILPLETLPRRSEKKNIFISKNKEASIKQMIGAIYCLSLKAISACVGRLDNEILKNDN